jgi:hypothetical protein
MVTLQINSPLFNTFADMSYILDTIELAKQSPKMLIPEKCSLSVLYNY